MPSALRAETAMFLNGYTPAGLEMAIAEHALPAPSRTLPPKGATPPPAMTPELMRRYGMDNVPGPNPLAPDGTEETGMTTDDGMTAQRVSDGEAVARFTLAVAQAELEDLAKRLAQTRWPDAETVEEPGPPLAKLQALVARWRDGSDWRRCEALLNGFEQYRTQIDGLGIHFLHIRSGEADALPLILTHGRPGSVLEFRNVIGPLTDPVAHDGSARDALPRWLGKPDHLDGQCRCYGSFARTRSATLPTASALLP